MATIKQVAELAGVGTSTVSRYLNARGYISEEAKEKIKNACEQLNYMPNELARAMKSNHSKTIGVMIPTICNPFFTELVHIIEQNLLKQGYKTVLCNTNGDIELERNYLNMAISNRFDGIILITGSYEFMELKADIPIILLDRINEDDLNYITLTSNNRQGAALATEHLIACGCKKILYLSSNEQIIPAKIREDMFVETVVKHKISYTVRNNSEVDIVELKKMIEDGVDGIFAWNDISAIQCIGWLSELGIVIPDQVQVMGYDNIDIAEYVHPKLTTIAQPLAELATKASEYIVRLIDKNIAPPINIQLDNTLVVRQSTKTI
ncbi:transcriptional regulator, LacI family [Anaerosporobacter mobilis DSM 15930]|jgi:DNA-binding LacI/PurR family transcriptional regulator|uniref:Transcriptional regulator, LacI family n=1 Tax=Anaerosporobacter mobilis DSM 15930 TaxID=1120996 RepID=A0A1M7IHI1_9FIRM|nr:LacI family DNA-binding transcriptional regulator [Anaerosporobacter mobilis]SHM40234.1 transcriptional regulator, LacI family [Anaerosporobacter mobilis DSM 15930]